jgi:hypothetical protein
MGDDVSRAARTGGCQCGAIRYEVGAAPLAVYCCHCRECRKQSASAFGISVIVPRAGFRLVSGSPKRWSRPTDSGRTLDCLFCPECGSRLWHERPGADAISVKGGSLDEPPDLTSAFHIWTVRMVPGVIIREGAVRFEREPDEGAGR